MKLKSKFVTWVQNWGLSTDDGIPLENLIIFIQSKYSSRYKFEIQHNTFQ